MKDLKEQIESAWENRELLTREQTIKAIETVRSSEDYVYDLEINRVHNFVANGVVVHNSQLLKRTSKIAPKARYVSGKGVSGAGLCVDGESLILTNPGEINKIKDMLPKFMVM